MTGRAGINVVSSAQSIRVGTGVGHGSTGLDRISARDGSGKTAADKALVMAAAMKGTGDGVILV
jgi:hypothetical protein